MDLTKVPQCLISILERVEINKLNMCEGAEIKLATYFLMNSEVLKKLSLNDSRMANEDINFYTTSVWDVLDDVRTDKSQGSN
ncbi:hypothetical protein YC2023_115842 [Brassica napus]